MDGCNAELKDLKPVSERDVERQLKNMPHISDELANQWNVAKGEPSGGGGGGGGGGGASKKGGAYK